MAFDEGLAERIRAHLGEDPAITEKRMFGGLAFLRAGSMAVGGILMVRVGPDATDTALARPGAGIFDFTGRPMHKGVVVDSIAVSEDAALAGWIDRARLLRPACHPKGAGWPRGKGPALVSGEFPIP